MASDGPEPDYERLVRAHHGAVYRSAWRILRHEEDARDVAQEVFLDVLAGPRRFAAADDPARVLRWLAARKALARLRGDRHRRGREAEHTMHDEQQSGDEVLAEAEVRGIVARELAALADELRCALVLRFAEGMSFAGIAEALGVSAPTARERVERGLERLRARLARAGCAAFAPLLPELVADEAPAAAPAGLEAGLLALGAGAAAKGAGAGAGLGVAALVLIGVAAAAALLSEREAARAAEEAAVAAAASVRADVPPAAALALDLDTGERIVLVEVDPSPGAAPAAGSAAAQERRTGRVVGRVVDGDRRALGGVEVFALSIARDGKLARYRVEGESDADGRFALDVPVEDARGQLYRVLTRHPDFVPLRTEELDARVDATLDLGERALLRRADDLPGAWSADVFVVDEAGAPVAGAAVLVERLLLGPEEARPVARECGGRTDAAGRVRLTGERLGDKRARVLAEAQGFRAMAFELPVARPGHDAFTFVLERGYTVLGRVRTVDGAALEGTPQVHAVGPDASRWLDARVLADGRFELPGLDPALEYELLVDLDGWSPARVAPLAPDMGELTVTLKRADDARDVGDHRAELHGRVVDAETGAPVAVDFWAVDALWLPPAERERPASWLFAEHRIGTMAQRAAFGELPEPTDAIHRVGLRGGSYLLYVHEHGYAPALAGPFHLAEGQLVSGVELRLERGATLAGRVRDAGGTPLAEAFVWLGADGPDAATRLAGLDAELLREDPRWLPRCVRTDAAGAFRFERLPTGLPYRLGVLHAERAAVLGPAVELAPREERAELELRAGGRR